MIELLNQIYFFNSLKNISPYLADVIAILSSVCAGLVIGWDREQSGKAAGFRTFALVCLGSCLFTLIAKELNTADSVSRIVAQIVSGIGFIGAGAVFRDKNKISGLTTAAGIWVCSAIGVVFGLGYLPFGILITSFVFVLFRIQRKAEKKLKRVGILIFCLFQSQGALANETQIQKDPHNKGLLSSVNLGIRYSSILENRGVIFYNDFQIDPVLGLFFLDDRVEFLGDSIGFRDFAAGKWLRLRTRLVSISDDPLFPAKEAVKSGAPNREDSFEWSNRIELFLPAYDDTYWGEFSLGYAKDISVHKGDYADLQSKIKIARLRLPFGNTFGNTLIEPNFHAGIGWGDSNHNQYFYGSDANSAGFNNLSYGLWFAFPEEADRYYPIVKITHFEVLGDFKNSVFSKNRNEGWLFSFIATYGFFE